MLFLDTEFNGFGGKLISMALVSSYGDEWYEAVEMNDPVIPWVAENVIPKIGKNPLPMKQFRDSLHSFLAEFHGERIYADWHSDFIHFFSMLDGDDYGSSLAFSCEAVLVQNSKCYPDNPHNALSDARALKKWYDGE